MEFHDTEHNGVRILRLTGRLDAPSAPDAQNHFESVVAQGPGAVVLDFSGVEYISSGGIRAVIALERGCKHANIPLKMCALNPFVQQVFEISNLVTLFDIHRDRDAALAALEAAN